MAVGETPGRDEAARLIRAAVLASATPQALASSVADAAPDLSPRTATPSRYNIRVPLRAGRALVYNSLTGAFALWDRDDLAAYKRVERGPVDLTDPELSALSRGGYVVPTDADELAEVEKRYSAARSDPRRMILTIAPTLACNFGCDYCFQGREKPPERMSPEVQDALTGYLERRLPELRALSIAWYGGEPLIARPIVRELSDRMVALCDRARVAYSAMIVTNGFLLTRPLAQELCEHRVTLCQVTLDGPEAYHDTRRPLLSGKPTYARIVDNLCDIVGHVPLPIVIRVNIDERNQDTIRELIEDLAARGLGGRRSFRLYFAPVEAITEGCHGCNRVTMRKRSYGKLETELQMYAFEKQLTALPQPPKLHGLCQAIRPNGLLVNPTGDLHKCWDTVSHPELKVGTIFEVDALAADEQHRRWLEWTPLANDLCRGCKILPNCAGACAYKFVHNDKTSGEAGVLPCLSWKFNMNERLFLRAEKLGLVSADDWDGERSQTSPSVVGANHCYSSMGKGEPGLVQEDDPKPI